MNGWSCGLLPVRCAGPLCGGALEEASRQEIDVDRPDGELRISVSLEQGTTTVAFERRSLGDPPPEGPFLSIVGARLLDSR